MKNLSHYVVRRLMVIICVLSSSSLSWMKAESASFDCSYLRSKYCHSDYSSEQHTACKYCGIGPRCPLYDDAPSGRGIEDSLKMEILQRHNIYRTRVRNGQTELPASKCLPALRWDDDLAEVAQVWADQCANVIYSSEPSSSSNSFNINNNSIYPKIFHEEAANRVTDSFHSFPGVGQNVAWALTNNVNFSQIIDDLWYRDIQSIKPDFLFKIDQVLKKDDPTDEEMHLSSDTMGTITQMIWGETTHVGCGWIQFFNKNPNFVGKFENFFVCNYGIGGNVIGKPVYTIGEDVDDCNSDDKTLLVKQEVNSSNVPFRFRDKFFNASASTIHTIEHCLNAIQCFKQINISETIDCRTDHAAKCFHDDKIENLQNPLYHDSLYQLAMSRCRIQFILCELEVKNNIDNNNICHQNQTICQQNILLNNTKIDPDEQDSNQQEIKRTQDGSTTVLSFIKNSVFDPVQKISIDSSQKIKNTINPYGDAVVIEKTLSDIETVLKDGANIDLNDTNQKIHLTSEGISNNIVDPLIDKEGENIVSTMSNFKEDDDDKNIAKVNESVLLRTIGINKETINQTDRVLEPLLAVNNESDALFNPSLFYNSSARTTLQLAICLQSMQCGLNSAKCLVLHQNCNVGIEMSNIPSHLRPSLSECTVIDILCHLEKNLSQKSCQQDYLDCTSLISDGVVTTTEPTDDTSSASCRIVLGLNFDVSITPANNFTKNDLKNFEKAEVTNDGLNITLLQSLMVNLTGNANFLHHSAELYNNEELSVVADCLRVNPPINDATYCNKEENRLILIKQLRNYLSQCVAASLFCSTSDESCLEFIYQCLRNSGYSCSHIDVSHNEIKIDGNHNNASFGHENHNKHSEEVRTNMNWNLREQIHQHNNVIENMIQSVSFDAGNFQGLSLDATQSDSMNTEASISVLVDDTSSSIYQHVVTATLKPLEYITTTFAQLDHEDNIEGTIINETASVLFETNIAHMKSKSENDLHAHIRNASTFLLPLDNKLKIQHVPKIAASFLSKHNNRQNKLNDSSLDFLNNDNSIKHIEDEDSTQIYMVPKNGFEFVPIKKIEDIEQVTTYDAIQPNENIFADTDKSTKSNVWKNDSNEESINLSKIQNKQNRSSTYNSSISSDEIINKLSSASIRTVHDSFVQDESQVQNLNSFDIKIFGSGNALNPMPFEVDNDAKDYKNKAANVNINQYPSTDAFPLSVEKVGSIVANDKSQIDDVIKSFSGINQQNDDTVIKISQPKINLTVVSVYLTKSKKVTTDINDQQDGFIAISHGALSSNRKKPSQIKLLDDVQIAKEWLSLPKNQSNMYSFTLVSSNNKYHSIDIHKSNSNKIPDIKNQEHVDFVVIGEDFQGIIQKFNRKLKLGDIILSPSNKSRPTLVQLNKLTYISIPKKYVPFVDGMAITTQQSEHNFTYSQEDFVVDLGEALNILANFNDNNEEKHEKFNKKTALDAVESSTIQNSDISNKTTENGILNNVSKVVLTLLSTLLAQAINIPSLVNRIMTGDETSTFDKLTRIRNVNKKIASNKLGIDSENTINHLNVIVQGLDLKNTSYFDTLNISNLNSNIETYESLKTIQEHIDREKFDINGSSSEVSLHFGPGIEATVPTFFQGSSFLDIPQDDIQNTISLKSQNSQHSDSQNISFQKKINNDGTISSLLPSLRKKTREEIEKVREHVNREKFDIDRRVNKHTDEISLNFEPVNETTAPTTFFQSNKFLDTFKDDIQTTISLESQHNDSKNISFQRRINNDNTLSSLIPFLLNKINISRQELYLDKQLLNSSLTFDNSALEQQEAITLNADESKVFKEIFKLENLLNYTKFTNLSEHPSETKINIVIDEVIPIGNSSSFRILASDKDEDITSKDIFSAIEIQPPQENEVNIQNAFISGLKNDNVNDSNYVKELFKNLNKYGQNDQPNNLQGTSVPIAEVSVINATVTEDFNYARSIGKSSFNFTTVVSTIIAVVILMALVTVTCFITVARRRKQYFQRLATPTQSRTTFSNSALDVGRSSLDDTLTSEDTGSLYSYEYPVDQVVPIDGRGTIITSYTEFLSSPQSENSIMNSPNPSEGASSFYDNHNAKDCFV